MWLPSSTPVKEYAVAVGPSVATGTPSRATVTRSSPEPESPAVQATSTRSVVSGAVGRAFSETNGATVSTPNATSWTVVKPPRSATWSHTEWGPSGTRAKTYSVAVGSNLEVVEAQPHVGRLPPDSRRVSPEDGTVRRRADRHRRRGAVGAQDQVAVQHELQEISVLRPGAVPVRGHVVHAGRRLASAKESDRAAGLDFDQGEGDRQLVYAVVGRAVVARAETPCAEETLVIWEGAIEGTIVEDPEFELGRVDEVGLLSTDVAPEG